MSGFLGAIFEAKISFGLNSFLFVSSLLFLIGLSACLYRRNAIAILIGLELMLNSVMLNFVSFWYFSGAKLALGDGAGLLSGNTTGPIMVLVALVLGVCESALVLAIVLNFYHNFASVDVDKADCLKFR